jgi:hypothetical protein
MHRRSQDVALEIFEVDNVTAEGVEINSGRDTGPGKKDG